jgi:hypothetical protein
MTRCAAPQARSPPPAWAAWRPKFCPTTPPLLRVSLTYAELMCAEWGEEAWPMCGAPIAGLLPCAELPTSGPAPGESCLACWQLLPRESVVGAPVSGLCGFDGRSGSSEALCRDTGCCGWMCATMNGVMAKSRRLIPAVQWASALDTSMYENKQRLHVLRAQLGTQQGITETPHAMDTLQQTSQHTCLGLPHTCLVPNACSMHAPDTTSHP